MDDTELDLKDKRIVVTGGSGFLGSFVVERLRSGECADVVVPRRQQYDLTRQEAAAQVFSDFRPEILIHLAATVGGIGANRENPGRFFYENMAMGLHVVEEARRYGRLKKLVVVGTTCSYPRDTPTPFREEDLWSGYPEPTNAPYGIAKKALLVMLQGYRAQYRVPGIYLLPANLYGPRDNFDPASSHVIPALIRKVVDARENGEPWITGWGTGQASREFLYVADAAAGIVLASRSYNRPEPVNLGTGDEIEIKDLVAMIANLAGYGGEVRWDRSQPDGQPKRRLDIEKAWKHFGFRAATGLKIGLERTLEWYEVARNGSGGADAEPPYSELTSTV